MTEPMTADRRSEIAQQIEAAATELGEVCAQGPSNRFRMHIPADPKRDTDLIIGAALDGGAELLAEVERLQALTRELSTALVVARNLCARSPLCVPSASSSEEADR